MVLEDYLTNPMGKGSSVMMTQETKRVLDLQYSMLESKMRVNWYLFKRQYLVAHVRIPSKSVENVFYDVIFEFDKNSIPEGKNTINRATVKCFSNCPSFTYTFAYVFKERGILCDWTRSKYEPEVLNRRPEVRNSYELITYERSIYLAARFVLAHGRNNVRNTEIIAFKTDNFSTILSRVKTQQEIDSQYKLEKSRLLAKAKNSNIKPTVSPSTSTKPKTDGITKGVEKTSKTKTSTKTSKTTNRTKKTKRI